SASRHSRQRQSRPATGSSAGSPAHQQPPSGAPHWNVRPHRPQAKSLIGKVYRGLEIPRDDPTCFPERGRRPIAKGDSHMASIQRFDPFNELVDDLFKGFLVRPLSYEGRNETLPRMKVDVAERNGAYTVTAELPGVKKEDIQVTIDGAQVTLTAEVK